MGNPNATMQEEIHLEFYEGSDREDGQKPNFVTPDNMSLVEDLEGCDDGDVLAVYRFSHFAKVRNMHSLEKL